MTGHATLTAALRAHAQGLYYLQAAAELLIGHHTRLRRSDFAGFITTACQPGGAQLAYVDWHAAITAPQAGQLPCSPSESAMLRIAASLAEEIPVDLRDTLTHLDSHNATLAARAVKHATGHQ